MKDFSRYLPLSQREHHDESAVTGDWSPLLRATLGQLADLVARLDDASWHGPSLRPSSVVADEVMAAISAALPRREPAHPLTTRVDAVAELRSLADRIGATGKRTKIGALSGAVVAALDVAHATGTPITLDPIATGAVAIARSARAPLGIREVLRGHRFVAVDAEWSVGSGATTDTTAQSIILFLFERAGLPAPLGS